MNLKELHEKKTFLQERQRILLHEQIEEFGNNYPNSIGAKNQLRIENQLAALMHIKVRLQNNCSICEYMVKDIHELLMRNMIVGGVYRNTSISISDTDYIPPSPEIAYQDIKYYYYLIDNMCKEQDPIKLAAYTHTQFVTIHPFEDGNGRTARILMNYQLLKNGFYPLVIEKNQRGDYLDRIKDYQLRNNLNSFMEFVYDLEDKKLDLEIGKVKTR
jgi:Fic family protein